MKKSSYFSQSGESNVNEVTSVAHKSLRDVMFMLRRRKILIGSTVIISSLITLLVLTQIVPKYSAKTFIGMERRGVNIVNIDSVTSGLPGDESTFNGEIELLRSRNLAKKVIHQLELDKVNEFSTNGGLRSELFNNFSSYMVRLGLKEVNTEKTHNIKGNTDYDIGLPTELRILGSIQVSVVDQFLSQLQIVATGSASRVIEVNFTSIDPVRAALVANTVARVYQELELEQKSAAVKGANQWLDGQLVDLREKAISSEREVEAFRKKAGLLRGKDSTLTTQQVSEINSQLVLSKAARVEAETRFQMVKELSQSSEGVDSATDVLASETIQKLRLQEAILERKQTGLKIKYGKLHPKMVEVVGEKKDLDKLIALELSKIVQSYKNNALIARIRENSLRSSLGEMQDQMADANSSSVILRALEREAKANRTILESFLARFKETSLQEKMDSFQTDSKIISHADIPIKPSSPRKKLILVLVIITSTLLAIFLAFFIESLDKKIRSGEELERLTAIPCLGLVPKFRKAEKIFNQSRPFSYEYSLLLEAIRSIQSSIYFESPTETVKSLLVTSSKPDEGKSFLALSIARFQMKSAKRVIIVDADLRCPSLHTDFSVSRESGLSEFLLGELTLEQVIQHDDQSGLFFITAGKQTSDVTSLIASEKMKNLLSQLQNVSDLVLVDSPPLLAVSDARYLSKWVDTTVYVARWSSTDIHSIQLGLQQLQRQGANLVGTILTQVDVKKHAGYGYSDSGMYAGKLRKYYA